MSEIEATRDALDAVLETCNLARTLETSAQVRALRALLVVKP